MMTQIPQQAIAVPAAQLVMKTLTDAGHRALFVGGTVRNALLGAPVTDFDIATDAEPTRVMELAEAASVRAVPTGLEHGTVTLVVDGQPLEVTTFRRDVDTHGRHATVAFSTNLTDDALRRDFTMNALYAEADGTVVDPLGGLADLTARRVRFVGKAEDRIREDFLRILRFFRFSAWFADPSEGLDPDGLAACAELADGMQQLSSERVWSEIKKLLAAPDPAWVVAPMALAGVLSRCLPGATSTGLAPLIHAENMLDLSPDPLRRLVALGGDAPEAALRLSRVEARHLDTLRTAVATPISALELGHTLGSDVARDVVALRFAVLESLFSEETLAEIDKGAAAEFPVRASDLPAHLNGPEIGQTLAWLRAIWLAEDCVPTKSDLVDRV